MSDPAAIADKIALYQQLNADGQEFSLSSEDMDTIVDALRFKAEGHKFIPWQQVFQSLIDDAAAIWPPGTRYEIRLLGKRPWRYATKIHESWMNRVDPWTNTTEETPDYFRVGRCVVPLKKEPP